MLELLPVAYAQDAPSAQGGVFSLLLPFIFLGIFMWFFLFRPQKKQRVEHQKMISALKPGDEVVTSGGLLGRIAELKDNRVVLEVADAVSVQVQRNSILAVLPNGSLDGVSESKNESES